MSDYYELRKQISQVIPRMTRLINTERHQDPVREKGRKTKYSEFRLDQNQWVKQERLLNTEEVNSFLEVSCRAAACPMPLNLDVWDGLKCPFSCRYCFADAFRASLYTSFFDNSKSMGLRSCNPTKYKREMDKLMKYRGKDPHKVKGDLQKAIAMNLPIRFGIRFEDFTPTEAQEGVSLELLKYLVEIDYPVMINTKSDLVGRDEYLKILAQNPKNTAVHVTLISSDDFILKRLEPGAPSYQKRMETLHNLSAAGIRAVARIEPWMCFVNDREPEVKQYIEDLLAGNVKNITFDTYSHSANNPGIRQSFINLGFDWERIFLSSCDSQPLASILMGEFMKLFQEKGISCSTFDMGNVPINDQSICCEVGDWFEGKAGYNYGCAVMAARFIQEKSPLRPVSWEMFENYVNENGGFLSESLKMEMHLLWNMQGKSAYSPGWAQGMEVVGESPKGLVWRYSEAHDFRKEIEEIFNKIEYNS